LRRSALTDAFARGRSEREGEVTTLAGLAARGYWDAVAGLVRASLVLLPPAGPVRKDEP
jgi:hypothetical protein